MPTTRPWDAVAPGDAWRGWWETGIEGIPTLPILAARGADDGPTVLVTGAVHGDEYEGPAAIQRLFERAGVGRPLLRGRLLGVPVVNTAAWAARTRLTPADGGDLNRVFPGSAAADVGPTAALAEAVFAHLVRACDVLVDLHSGGVALIHLPLVGWYTGGDADDRSEGLARGFDAALHPWIMPDVPGVLSCEAHRAGKIAVAAEWGGGARLDREGVAAYERGLWRLLAALDMVAPVADADAMAPDTREPIAGDYVATEVGGIFTPAVALGDPVAAGQTLGVLRDALGAVAREVRSPRAGIVAGLPHRALLHPGERVAYVG